MFSSSLSKIGQSIVKKVTCSFSDYQTYRKICDVAQAFKGRYRWKLKNTLVRVDEEFEKGELEGQVMF